MGLVEREIEVYECASCGTIGAGEDMTCCGGPMAEVATTVTVDSPELESLVREVFGMSKLDLHLCRVLMTKREATISDLTAALDRDRTSITRRLNHLVDVGVLEKRSKVLPDGGRANVYAANEIHEVHRQLRLGLYAWLLEAVDHIEELNEEKIAAMVDRADVAVDDRAQSDSGDSAIAMDAGAGETADEDDAERSVVDRLLGRKRSD